MTVTVIMSTFNDVTTVDRALRSIEAQTYDDWSMIVVDDASTDGTASRLAEASSRDARISVLTNASNSGLAASLNRAITQVHTPLVARMDADDISHPDRLRQQVGKMREAPDVDVLGTGVVLVNDGNQQLGVAALPATHEALVADMYRCSPFYHPTVMYRRAYIERAGGYDQRLRRGQDQDLWLRTYRNSTFANLGDALLAYRVRAAPSWTTALSGAYVLGLNAWRERSFAKSFYAPRYFLAASIARLR